MIHEVHTFTQIELLTMRISSTKRTFMYDCSIVHAGGDCMRITRGPRGLGHVGCTGISASLSRPTRGRTKGTKEASNEERLTLNCGLKAESLVSDDR